MTSTRPTALAGRVVDGRYRVVRHLADGGMGSVYLAVDERLDRDVALKVMRDDLTRDPALVERFRKEARAAARLSHPNVVAVYDQGRDKDVVFLVMEFIEGETLRAVLDRDGALRVGAALDIADDILSALATAHRAGIVHRDVKPENVLLSADDTVKVADFGLARAVSSHTATSGDGTLLGTVGYLAPEQVERGIADARSDVYAAGLLLYELLTGAPAVDGTSAIHIAYQHVHTDVPSLRERAPDLPEELDALVLAPTRRDPDERPRDAAAFRHELHEVRRRLTPAELRARARDGARGESTNPAVETGRIVRATNVIPVAARPAARLARSGMGATRLDRLRRSLRARWWAGGVLAATALAAVLLLGPVSSREVPRVVGRTQADAVAALATQDLRAEVTNVFSESVAAGSVVSSDPDAGSSTLRWRPVALVVSKGPERHEVPDLSGRTREEAARMLTDAHLRLGQVEEAFNETTPAGRVSGSEPSPGTPLRPDAAVDVTVSMGRRPVPLVDWSGKPLADARKALEPWGVTVRVGGEKYSTDVARGSVLTQQPGPTTLHSGDTVTFTVSKGPDLVTVPSVRGLTEDEARSRLEAAGFVVEVDRIAGGLFGTAHSTDPQADERAPRGSTVTLRIV